MTSEPKNHMLTTSRFQSAQKGDYFPTDMAAVVEIARILNVEEGTPILDPSCGKGRAIAHLGMTWGCPTYGNEIDRERYDEAKNQLTHAVRGAAETLDIRRGVWPIVFNNPPYNEAESGRRLEIEHTKQSLDWARNNGAVIFVLPKDILARQDFWHNFFYRGIDDFYVYEMVGRDFERFHQYVVIGLTPSWTSTYHYGAVAKAQQQAEAFAVPSPVCTPITKAPVIKTKIHRGRINEVDLVFRNRMPNLGEHLEALASKYPDPFGSGKYQSAHAAKAELVHQNAVAPCRATHVIQLAAAGVITGATIPLSGVPYYWVGSWRRFITTATETDEDGGERQVDTEDIAYVLRGMNLRTGHFVEIDSENDPVAYAKFLEEHTEDLMNAVDEASPPRYQMNYEKYLPYFRLIHSPRQLPGHPDGPFTAQKHVGASILELFADPKGNEHAIIVGEMGTGKTMTSMMTMAIQSGMMDFIIDPSKYARLEDMAANKLNRERVPWPTIVVMCPAIVAPKWCHEADAVLKAVPGFKSFHIGREAKQDVIYPHTPNGAREGLMIIDYRGLQAKMSAGSLTNAERERFYYLQGILIEGEYSSTERKKIENDRKTGQYQRGKPTRKGTVHTYFGERHFDEHEDASSPASRYVERFGQAICPTYKAHTITIRRPIKDTQEAMSYQGPRLLAIDFQRAKNGAPWDHVAIPKVKKVSFKVKHESEDRTGKKTVTMIPVTKEMIVWHCPHCGGMLLDTETGKPWTRGKKTEDEFCTDTQKRVRRVCTNDIPVWDADTKEWTTRPCNTALYQCQGFSKGGRWPVAGYLNEFHSKEYHAILDEAHNAKSGDTNVGAASHHLISGSVHTIAMTGTIFNGYARSLFYLLYRLDSTFRQMYGFDDVEQFVQTHGLIETITVRSQESARRTSAYGYSSDESSHTREIPGASPELVAMMAPFSVWLRLVDVGIELPERTEMVVPIQMGPDLAGYYNQIESLRNVAVQAFIEGDRGPMSKWFWLALGGLDRPDAEDLVGLGSVLGCAMPDDGYAKDRQLVNLVTNQLNRDRGVAIFVEQVNRRDARDRIKVLLARHGIHADVLDRSTCNPDERMIVIGQWIKEAEKRRRPPVLIANGALVKEGVDLLEFPTIVEVGQQFNVTQLRQRAARSHRIGQTKKVELYYLYYQGTYQEDALGLIAAKLFAMDQVDGNIPAGLSGFKMSENNFMVALLKSAEAVDRPKLSDLMQTATFDVREELIAHVDEKPKKTRITTAQATIDSVASEPVKYVNIVTKKDANVVQMGFVF